MTGPTNPRAQTPRGERSPVDGARGFALLSVIFFVLALTILGLSLFSLSNYEARFFNPALDRAAAVQAARGGVDWVRYVVESTDSLEVVWDDATTMPPDLVYAVAWRDDGIAPKDSVGSAFEEPLKPVVIRALAAHGGQVHEVEARFEPDAGVDLYKRLITAADYVRVDHEDEGGEVRSDQLLLNGRIATARVRDEDNNNWPASAFGGNWCRVSAPAERPEKDLKGVWWTERYADPATQQLAVPLHAGDIVLALDARGSEYRYFRTNELFVDFEDRRWSVLRDYIQEAGEIESVTLRVGGVALWMLPEGFKVEQQLRIESLDAQEATIVFLARPGPCSPGPCDGSDVGVTFQGGLDVNNVNVFVATVGGAEIQYEKDHANEAGSGTAGYLSIYSDWVRIRAPKDNSSPAPNYLQLFHGPECGVRPAQDAPNGLVDQLIRKNLLPNSRFARRHLAFTRQKGLWQETPVATSD